LSHSAITEQLNNRRKAPDADEDPEDRLTREAPCLEIMNRWLDDRHDIIQELAYDHHATGRAVEQGDILDLNGATEDEIDYVDDDENNDDIEVEENISITGLKEYKNLICNHPGYKWLLERLRRDIDSTTEDRDTVRNV
jgi:hypothetical protein